MNCKTMLKNLSKKVEKNMPTILTVAGICGFWTSGYLVYKATPKYELVRKSLYETGEPEKIEIVKSGLKVYAPAFITATLSTICLIGANSMSIHRHAALVAAYALSEANLKEFKETAEELTTSKQFEKIKDAVAAKKIENNPPSKQEIISTTGGNTLCYEVVSGRYFRSSVNAIKKAENEVNSILNTEGQASFNTFCTELGLAELPIGEDLGWSFNFGGLMKVDISTGIAKDLNDEPCLVVSYANGPDYNYDNF